MLQERITTMNTTVKQTSAWSCFSLSRIRPVTNRLLVLIAAGWWHHSVVLHLVITCGAAVMRHQSATTFMTQFESFHHRGFTTDADFDFRFDRFQGDDAFEDNQRNEFRIDGGRWHVSLHSIMRRVFYFEDVQRKQSLDSVAVKALITLSDRSADL